MTLDEAKIMAGMIARVDGGCGTCIAVMCDYMNEAFPDFIWSAPGGETTEFVRYENDPEEFYAIPIVEVVAK